MFVDATLGLGGHAEALLEASPLVRIVGIDRDPEALAIAKERLARFGDRLVTVQGRHEDVAAHLDALGIDRVAGVLADLGVSSMQIDRAERGFSFMKDGPLDMRMGPDGPTAADLVATASRDELTRIFREWGEERMAGPIARRVVEAREKAPIRTTGEMRRPRPPGARPATGEAQGPRDARLPGPPDRDEPRARRARAFPRRRDRAPRARRAALGPLVPLARGPHRQARLPAPHGRLHVPAVVPRVRLLAPPRDGARHEEGHPPHARRARREPARPLGAPPRPRARRRGVRPADAAALGISHGLRGPSPRRKRLPGPGA